MGDLLLLVHRIPYPPDKGDKIRSWHLLQHLCKHHRVYLGAFIDDPADREHVGVLENMCADVFMPDLKPLGAKLRSLTGLASGRPLTEPYYFDRSMQRWVDKVLQKPELQAVVVYSSAMCQYVTGRIPEQARYLIDFVDIDSDKWQQYSRSQSFPMDWVYAREARTLATFERDMAREADVSTFVSRAEAEAFAERAPELGARVSWYNNGVDGDYFAPEHAGDSPYEADDEVLVFTGAMDYWANVDAVDWFAREVFPAILLQRPRARFVIVGTRPTDTVQSLGMLPGVTVTGRVEDVRPWVAHAHISVAPLRIARGIQNKVLEAMALGQTVIASQAAFEGIDAEPGKELLLADGRDAWVEAILGLLDAPRPQLGQAARARVVNDYAWSGNLARVDELLAGQAGRGAA